MGYEKTPGHRSAMLIAVMAALATLLDCFPAQLLHIEPVTFRGFGLFCVSCSMLLSFLGGQAEAPQSVSVVLAALQGLLSLTCFAPVLELPQVPRYGQVVRSHTSIFPLLKQAAQVRA
jgi:hypothetical protein